jgi:hypothetical protein
MLHKDKSTVWKQKLIEMDHLQDGWGTELDAGIKETVAVLQLLGVIPCNHAKGIWITALQRPGSLSSRPIRS